jgi:prepilin-type N-terminal cleavage/methylation domain-containing protein/prepilin-type processing-associated H-X9-DG protein
MRMFDRKSNAKPRRETRCAASCRKNAKLGFTLIELLVVVTIIAVLVAILLPALNAARFQTRTMLCADRLRNWGMGYRMYSMENNGNILFYAIGNGIWQRHWSYYYPENKYLGGLRYNQANRCPVVDANEYYLQYGLNAELFTWGQGAKYWYKEDRLKPEGYLMTDTIIGQGQGGAYGYGEQPRHREKGNYLLPDGHVTLIALPVPALLPIRDVIEEVSF